MNEPSAILEVQLKYEGKLKAKLDSMASPLLPQEKDLVIPETFQELEKKLRQGNISENQTDLFSLLHEISLEIISRKFHVTAPSQLDSWEIE